MVDGLVRRVQAVVGDVDQGFLERPPLVNVVGDLNVRPLQPGPGGAAEWMATDADQASRPRQYSQSVGERDERLQRLGCVVPPHD